VLPKLIVYYLLEPALRRSEPLHLICSEGKPDDLLAKLSTHELDVFFSDSEVHPDISVRAFSHLLGQCNVTLLGTERLARSYRQNFPESLDGASILLPTPKAALRRSLDAYFDSKGLYPHIAVEVEDSALQMEFGRAGLGLVPVPSVIEKDVARKYGLKRVGRLHNIRERFYAISLERRIKHPAVVAILEEARESFFR
jgi:LysR family transcriptional activator of nhaA